MAVSQPRVLSFGEARNLVDNYRDAARVQSAASSTARSTRFANEIIPVGEVAAPHFLDELEESRFASRSRASRTKSHAKSRAKTGRTVSFEEISKKKPAKEDLVSEQKTSRISRFKRKAAKDKASRAFSRQYGNASSSDASQNAPRAALYKGELGKTQKRVTRMENMAAQSGSARNTSAYKAKRRSPRLAICLGVCACIVLSCVFLYPAAQQYYLSLREHDRLQAVYEALEQRNAVLQSEVDTLSTDDGIEDLARTELGWVMEGENLVKVYGIESSDEGDSAYVDVIDIENIEAPETWYSPLFDLVFGVS